MRPLTLLDYWCRSRIQVPPPISPLSLHHIYQPPNRLVSMVFAQKTLVLLCTALSFLVSIRSPPVPTDHQDFFR